MQNLEFVIAKNTRYDIITFSLKYCHCIHIYTASRLLMGWFSWVETGIKLAMCQYLLVFQVFKHFEDRPCEYFAKLYMYIYLAEVAVHCIGFPLLVRNSCYVKYFLT